MTLTYRLAQPADAQAIQTIRQIVWPEEATSLVQIQSAMIHPSHQCYVALTQDQVIGFLDSFFTTTPDHLIRLEMDLLAVHPAWQGKGIASQLIACCLEHAANTDVTFSRALIQVENISSQKAFQHNGFQCHSEPLTLVVKPSNNQADAVQKSKLGGTLVPVNTLGYAGYWIEPPFKAESILLPQPFQTAGALLPQNEAWIQLALEDGFETINTYQWWVLPIKE